MTPSPYEILELATTASPDEIRTAYRRLAKAWHPDRRRDDPEATERFQAINAAYEAIAGDITPARAPESVLWRASREQEIVVLTSHRVTHRVGATTQFEAAIRDILAVGMSPLPRHGTALLSLQTRSGPHVICLPERLAMRLAQLLSVRSP